MLPKSLVIEGNIGTGKTALSKRIADEFGKRLVLEEFEDNSFLPQFYEDPERYAFPLEMSFLAARFNQIKRDLMNPTLFDEGVVSDYIFFKCLVFSKINLSDDEYELYTKLFEIINLQVPQPDLILFLHKPVDLLLKNIYKRGRSYESHISEEYLTKLQQGYFDYMHQLQSQKIVILDSTHLDFVNKEEDYRQILEILKSNYPNGITVL